MSIPGYRFRYLPEGSRSAPLVHLMSTLGKNKTKTLGLYIVGMALTSAREGSCHQVGSATPHWLTEVHVPPYSAILSITYWQGETIPHGVVFDAQKFLMA